MPVAFYVQLPPLLCIETLQRQGRRAAPWGGHGGSKQGRIGAFNLQVPGTEFHQQCEFDVNWTVYPYTISSLVIAIAIQV